MIIALQLTQKVIEKGRVEDRNSVLNTRMDGGGITGRMDTADNAITYHQGRVSGLLIPLE